MIRVLIIEDEQLAVRRLREIFSSLDFDIHVLGNIDTIRDSVRWLSNNKADLLFVDIHLSDGISFEIFNQLDIKTPVIFTTAYDEYALRAFRLNSIDYLLKPFSRDDVNRALEKYVNHFHDKSELPDLKDLIRILNPERQYQKRFLVHAGGLIRSLIIEEIAYFYNLEKNTFICSEDNHHYASGQSLDKLEMMIDPEQYFRVNRNYLVGFRSIRKIFTLSKSRIKLELEPKPMDEVLVSFNKSGEFRQWLGKLPET